MFVLVISYGRVVCHSFYGDFSSFDGYDGEPRGSSEASRRSSVFSDWESSWLRGGGDSDLGLWYGGHSTRRVTDLDQDGSESYDDTEFEALERLEEEATWYRAGAEAQYVSGVRPNPRYRDVTAVRPGVWYQISTATEEYEAKNYFIRKSNELSRSWDEQISSGEASRTAVGAATKAKKRGKRPRQGQRRKISGRRTSEKLVME